jgi:hypothetical protein
MKHYSVDDVYNLLIDLNMFTKEELDLLTYINGFNFDTLEDALYCRYGYRSADQLLEELQEEEEEEEEEEEREE